MPFNDYHFFFSSHGLSSNHSCLFCFLGKKTPHRDEADVLRLNHPSTTAVVHHFDNLYISEVNSPRDKSCHGNMHLRPTRIIRFCGTSMEVADPSPSFLTETLDGDDSWACHSFLMDGPDKAEADQDHQYVTFIFQCSKQKAQRPSFLHSQSLHIFLLSHPLPRRAP